MRKILAAIDKSAHAHAVMSRTVELACLLRSDLTILTIIDSDPMRISSLGDEQERLASLHRELVFKHFPPNGITLESKDDNGAVYVSAPAGIRVQSRILPGDPVNRICSSAEEIDADLVVVGNRGLGNVGALVLGSVSERVVHKCSRSVLVVKGEGSGHSSWETLASAQKAGRSHAG